MRKPGNIAETTRIAWPLALAMMAGAMNHVCDRFFLAHSGDAALQAVLPAEMLVNMFVGFFTVTIGYSATFVAQCHGGGKHASAVRSFAQGLWLALFSLPLFALIVPAGNFIITLAGHPAEIQAAERSYLAIAAPSGVLSVLNAVLAGLLTGQGRTRYAGFCTVAGSLLNLALDPLLIFGFGPFTGHGISGAAVATILSFALTTTLLASAAFRDPLVREQGVTAFRFNAPRSLAILRFGSPAGLCTIVSTCSFMVFTMSVGKFDGLSFAASNTVFAVNNVFFLATVAISQGVTILTGRYQGAGDLAAARRTFRSGLFLTGILLAVCFSVTIPNAGFIMNLFRGSDSSFDPAAYRHIGYILFTIMLFREIAEGAALIAAGALKGVGDTKHVMLVQVAVDLLVRLPLIFLTTAFSSSIIPLWLTMPLTLGLTATLLIRRWRSDLWRTIHLTD